MKKILKNLLVAIGIISYFMILALANTRMDIGRLANDIKVFAGAFLVVAILAIEKAYKKDSGKIAIIGIELLVLSFHSLSIMHMVNIFKCDFNFYLITSSAVVAGYYVLKGIVTYTKDRKEYLRGLSDISEIVKKDEPIKKEAKKRNSIKSEKTKEIVNDEGKEDIDIKKETNPKKKTTTKKGTSTKKSTQTKKSTSTKKTNTDSKKVGTKKNAKSENNEEKVQVKRKTTNKNAKVEETKTDRKSEIAKKSTTNKKKETESTVETPKEKKKSTVSIPTKKTTKKSKKEVKEND